MASSSGSGILNDHAIGYIPALCKQMNEPIPCELISWAGFYRLCIKLTERIKVAGYHPDIIIAIGRGGLMPGRILADLLGLMNFTSFKIEHYRGPHKAVTAQIRYPLPTEVSGLRVLLVDDVSDSGDTFRVALNHVLEHGLPREIRTAVLHHKLTSAFTPDFHAQKIVKWRWVIYPWAVNEDLGNFLQEAVPRPATLEQAASWLKQQHGIQVPRQILETVWGG